MASGVLTARGIGNPVRLGLAYGDERGYAVVVAAGRGTRFGGALPKQYLPLGGGTVLRHAVCGIRGASRIAGVQVVIRDEDRALFDEAAAG